MRWERNTILDEKQWREIQWWITYWEKCSENAERSSCEGGESDCEAYIMWGNDYDYEKADVYVTVYSTYRSCVCTEMVCVVAGRGFYRGGKYRGKMRLAMMSLRNILTCSERSRSMCERSL